jgi:hypothetical protein
MALAPTLVSFGQGTLTITFDGPPIVPRGSGVYVQSYHESGFYFTPLPVSDGFGRQGGGSPFIPDNGTAYLQGTSGDSLRFSNVNATTFSLQAVDLAGYSTVVPDFSVPFVGYRPNGSTVATNFSGTGIDFRTFDFGPEFSGLAHVEIPTYAWSLDNLIISIPEPSVASLTFAAVLGLLLTKGKGSASRSKGSVV